MEVKLISSFINSNGNTYSVGDIVSIKLIDGKGGFGGCLITKITKTGFHYTQGRGREKSMQFKDIEELTLYKSYAREVKDVGEKILDELGEKSEVPTNLDRFKDIDYVAKLLNKYCCYDDVCRNSPFNDENGGCKYGDNITTENCIECTKIWLMQERKSDGEKINDDDRFWITPQGYAAMEN